MKSEDAAAVVKSGSSAEVERLRRELAADPEGAHAVLRDLAASRDLVVRGWVTGAARQLLERVAAISVLEQLINDQDSDVRSEALRELTAIDSGWARRATPRYMSMLRSKDVPEVVEAIWRLVQFREVSSLGSIAELAVRSPEPLVRNNAEVAALVLGGDEAALLAPLETHDHRRAPLLLKALAYLSTPTALQAIASYARTCPDEDCRRIAQRVMDKVEEVRPIGIH